MSAPALAAMLETVERGAELGCCRVCGRSGLLVNPFEPE